jgi:hypothetical protein
MTMIPAFLLQDDGSSAVATGAMAGLGIGFFLVMMVIAVVFIIGYWKVFEKAGQPGWAAIIPIYNAYPDPNRRQTRLVGFAPDDPVRQYRDCVAALHRHCKIVRTEPGVWRGDAVSAQRDRVPGSRFWELPVHWARGGLVFGGGYRLIGGCPARRSLVLVPGAAPIAAAGDRFTSRSRSWPEHAAQGSA